MPSDSQRNIVFLFSFAENDRLVLLLFFAFLARFVPELKGSKLGGVVYVTWINVLTGPVEPSTAQHESERISQVTKFRFHIV